MDAHDVFTLASISFVVIFTITAGWLLMYFTCQTRKQYEYSKSDQSVCDKIVTLYDNGNNPEAHISCLSNEGVVTFYHECLDKLGRRSSLSRQVRLEVQYRQAQKILVK